MSPRNRLSVSSLTSLVIFILFMAVLALLPAQSAYAQDNPTVAIITTTVELATTDTSITVPVVVTPTETYTYSAVSFVLQYDKDCVRIDNTSTDIAMQQFGFSNQQYVNDPDNGRLSVAIWDWDEIDPQTFVDGDLIKIRFGLQTACMDSATETTVFTFDDDPAVTFGRADNGGNVAGVGEQGTYTLNVNKSPTAIALATGSYSDNLQENVSIERQIGDLTATDANSGDTHTFALSSGCDGDPDPNDGFSIPADEPTKLFTDLTFDYETQVPYTLCVTANDGRGGSYKTTVTFNVVNVNEAPTWLELSVSTLANGAISETSIGTFSTTGDPDAGATHTFTIMTEGVGSDDHASFEIGGTLSNELLTKFAANYNTKSLYRIRVKTTDNGTPGLTFERQFVIKVVGSAVLSLPDSPDVPYVVATSSISVPIKYNTVGNDVVAATFAITYNTTCLEYPTANGLTELQAGFTDAGADTGADGQIDINMSSSSSALREGIIGYLSFTGKAACDPGRWTDLVILEDSSLRATGAAEVVHTKSNGKLVVVANDGRGDCNSSGQLDAGDFPAIAIEFFDAEPTYGALASPHWLLSPLGTYAGSAIGCDANADRVVGSGDIACAARKYFGLSCTTAVAAASIAPPVIAAPAAIAANPGANVTLPVSLQSQGNDVASLAFAVKVDIAQFALDPTDADADGVPDAITLNAPAEMLRIALYDPLTGEIQIVLAGMTMPLPVLEDGIVANIQLVGKAGASGSLSTIALEDVSLGDTEGGTLPVSVELVAPEGSWNTLYLPVTIR